MAIDKKIIDKLMKDYQSPIDIFCKYGVFKGLQKAILERILEGKISHHLGYEKNYPKGNDSGNSIFVITGAC